MRRYQFYYLDFNNFFLYIVYLSDGKYICLLQWMHHFYVLTKYMIWCTLVYSLNTKIKASLCRNWNCVRFGAPHSLRVWHHCRKHKPQICRNLSDVMAVLTTNKTHHLITILCVENLYVEGNMCNAVIWPSHWSHIAQKTSDGLWQRHCTWF